MRTFLYIFLTIVICLIIEGNGDKSDLAKVQTMLFEIQITILIGFACLMGK